MTRVRLVHTHGIGRLRRIAAFGDVVSLSTLVGRHGAQYLTDSICMLAFLEAPRAGSVTFPPQLGHQDSNEPRKSDSAVCLSPLRRKARSNGAALGNALPFQGSFVAPPPSHSGSDGSQLSQRPPSPRLKQVISHLLPRSKNDSFVKFTASTMLLRSSM